jgi:hypothetical protein
MKIILRDSNVNELLVRVDSVLEKYGRNDVPEKIKGQATMSCMKNLLENGHFSVCKVNDMAKMNDVLFSSEHKALFQSLHCVDWNDIYPETREYVAALLFDYFRGNVVMTNSEM